MSPIPGLTRWLQTQVDDLDHGAAAQAALEHTISPEDLRAITARYLILAKRSDNMPKDPVARFHLGNGAEIHDIHAEADTSIKGMAQSSGAMVNYLYNLDLTERNHEAFATDATVAASRAAQQLSTAQIQTKTKEPTA